ncbi:MAG: agmatinase [Salibacteraceae bacterium]
MRHFCGIEHENGSFENASVLLQSIPYDGTSTWGKGADQGFEAFMDALDNMEVYDIETQSEVFQKGVHVLPELKGFKSPEEMYEAVYAKAQELVSTGKFITGFGGEHSVSMGLMRAQWERHNDMSVLQLDAHTDLRPEYLGSPYNHACAVFEAGKQTNLVQVGIRSMDAEELPHIQEGNIFWAHEMYGTTSWMQKSVDRLTDKVYITLDLDVLDPSIMPATGTPEPGGLGWYETLTYLKMVFDQREVVGFDIVELAPISGLRAPNLLAAKLYYKMLSYKFQKHE